MGYRLALIILVSCTTIAGCSQESSPQTSKLPMISTDRTDGPWQLITYKGDTIIHPMIHFDEKERDVLVMDKSVYLSKESKLVYKDGTPINTYDGKNIYWNNQGHLLTSDLTLLKASGLFTIYGKPMEDDTPMRLKRFHEQGN